MKKVWQVVKAGVKRISGIMVHDFTRISTNPVAAIIAVGVMILPSLYTWFNIQASFCKACGKYRNYVGGR